MIPKPITIVHLITELNMGGAEQMLHKLVSRTDPKKIHSIVISMTDRGPIGKKIAAEGFLLYELGMALGRPNLSGLVKFYSILKQHSVDIVQTWLYHADLLGLITGRLAGVKRIVWGIRCSNMHLRNYRPLTALTVRTAALLSPLVDAIVVNSRKGMDVHQRRGYSTERMLFMPNGFDADRFHPDRTSKDWLLSELGLPRDAFLIGLVARFDPMKDQETFIKAAAKLNDQGKDVHFVMVGKGMVKQNEEIGRFLEEHQLNERVHLMGLRQDIPKLVSAFDITTSSSAFGEGFSNTIGEAMSCGVPCVVTDVGDSAFLVGDTGLVVPPKDPDAMAKAWAQMLKMGKDGRRGMGEKARQRIMENFELGIVVKRFEKFYEKLMKTHIGRR